MSKLFQITEEDLADLERALPSLVDMAMQVFDNNAARVKIRRVQQILSSVRWNYGPHSDVTVIPADGGEAAQ